MRKFLIILLVVFVFAVNNFIWAEEPKVTIYYHDYAQFELISPDGTRVLVDIYKPDKLSSPETAADLFLTTHSHWDHRHATFFKKFPRETTVHKVRGINS